MTSIAEKYAAQFMPNGEVSLDDLIQAALDERAETHAIELRAYEATVQNMEQRIRQLEAQSVAVVGEPLACDECGAATDDPWHSSEAGSRHFHRCDACHSKQTAELTTLREKAAMADELRKDAEIAVTSIYIALDALNEIIEMDGQDNLGDAKREATKAMAQLAAIAQEGKK